MAAPRGWNKVRCWEWLHSWAEMKSSAYDMTKNHLTFVSSSQNRPTTLEIWTVMRVLCVLTRWLFIQGFRFLFAGNCSRLGAIAKIICNPSSQRAYVLEVGVSPDKIRIPKDSRRVWLILLRNIRKEFIKCVILDVVWCASNIQGKKAFPRGRELGTQRPRVMKLLGIGEMESNWAWTPMPFQESALLMLWGT